MLLTARNISKTHGLQTLFTGVSLSIAPAERIGFIGPNGAGKSTLLRILAGAEDPDDGDLAASKGLRAVYVPQADHFPEAGDSGTPQDVLAHAAYADGRGVVHDPHEAEVLAAVTLARVGFDDAHAAAPVSTLSGGWRKRLSIARALAACGGEPDLLLLDEPTNHLDLAAIGWLEDLLTRPAPGRAHFASIFVTHDRAFLENVATRVVELNAAYPQGVLSIDGNYSEFLRRREEFLAGQAKAEQSLANQVRRDLAWLSRGAKARRTKQKSRIQASHERIGVLADLKGRNAAASAGGAKVDFAATGRRTRRLLTATGISKSLGGRALFKDLDLELTPGDCVGLLGPNGSGKTTLIRVLTGDLPPDAGTIRPSDPPPRIVVFSQHRREIPPRTLLREALCPVGDQVRFRDRAMHITAWSRRFLFRDAQLDQPVGSLSGGELARVHIARIMLEPADILVLDEPTNDLDIPTLELLEESLEDFPGALVLVTHDRAMLDRLATEIVALDGRGSARLYPTLDQALASQSAAPEQDKPRSARPAAPASTPPAPAPQRKKLSYNEQREYDTIEARIQEAEAAAAAAEAKVNDPAIAADHAKLAQACKALESAQSTVATLYARWEELEQKIT